MELTEKQQQMYNFMVELGKSNVHPTVRSATDRMETTRFASERWSDAEVRGLLERLQEKGLVTQYDDQGKQRYKLSDS